MMTSKGPVFDSWREIVNELRRGLRCLAVAFALLCVAGSPASARDALNIGDTPPDVLGKSKDGEIIQVSDHRGKIVIISFWAAWCTPCRQEIPVLNDIQRSAGAENLRVFSINIESREKFQKLKHAFKAYPVTLISDANQKVSPQYGVDGIPHMVIVGRDGKIASIHRGYSAELIPALVDEINLLWLQGAREGHVGQTAPTP